MGYRVTIEIDETDDNGDVSGNIDAHLVVTLTDYDQAMKIWNWVIDRANEEVT